ncbi:GH36-type glycosyl hydrolase domain-containing protein [Cerasicoccus fimbriatus]|uniref:GH36-type glycosyl hydrolase domain-containing protein n=1 Tax=Cerasicoccus fimbriatus TaxID=3014554 RepID=UPI0022B44750|nr:glycosyl hydrolase family 65 protein [Cerasicoccus sp. TK19100]
MSSSYGYFDDSNREYVITRPNTPRPWSNYIGNANFGGVITNNAAGYTFYRSAAQGKLTRYKFNAHAGELNGRYVYLRDQANGDFWSISWMPVKKPLAQFESTCRHGTGYTCIESTYGSIASEVTYFTPAGALYEVWRITVTNTGKQARHLKVFPCVEPQCNWSAEDDTKNLQYNQYISVTTGTQNLIDIGSNINMPEDPGHFENKDQARHTFFGLAGAKANAFDADLTTFLGTYGTYAAPEAVVQGRCSNSTASGDMPAAAFEIELQLAPGESKTFACVFGVGKAEVEGRVALQSMASTEQIDAALNTIKTETHQKLQSFEVQTPDAGFNSMLNTWAPYNCLMTFYWSRTASLVYAGERDGLGFRDTMQDMLGAMAIELDEAQRRIELLLTGQLANGGALPVVKPFAHTPGAMQEPDHYRADDCLWFFNAIPEFVRESGNIDFYKKVLPYADKGNDTVLAHMRRAMEFNFERCGAHGLPCGLHADWNDCLRLGESGESIFVAFQLRFALREYIDICERLSEPEEKEWATEKLKAYDTALAEHAWDGQWYLRAYRHDGLKFGSQENEEGSIFMNPQAWAIISGHADDERAAQSMQALRDKLSTEYGVMLCSPPYVKTDPKVALSVLFNPGMKENAGIFNHTQGWAVIAEAMLGHGDQAWQYFQASMPASYNDRADLREVEPYVVCQSTHSQYSPRFGAGRVSWLSGSATWNYHAATQYILGIRPDYDGLRIAPCLPSHWPEVSISRTFRGKRFDITIRNGSGQPKIVCNGQSLPSNLISMELAEASNQILVTL